MERNKKARERDKERKKKRKEVGVKGRWEKRMVEKYKIKPKTKHSRVVKLCI